MTAVQREGKFYFMGMKTKAVTAALFSVAIETVSCDRHAETLLRGGMDTQLMGTACKRSKHDAATAIPDFQEGVFR